MSFYGKVVNLDRAQFNFDKIYSSRYEMDHNIKTDGIYVKVQALLLPLHQQKYKYFHQMECFDCTSLNQVLDLLHTYELNLS